MSNKNYFNKNSQYVQSLVSFILDTKPYHSKLTETVEEYQFFDDVKVKFDERFLLRAKLDSHWNYNYFSSANPNFRTTPIQRVVNPAFSTGSFVVGTDENKDMALVPQVYNKKMLEHVGINATFVKRQNGVVEPLCESIDYFEGHGSYQFRILQTTNQNQFTHIVHNEAEMVALQASVGDTVARTDVDHIFRLTAEPASNLLNWEQLLTDLVNPLYVATNDDGIIAEAVALTRANALDVTKPQSAVNRVKLYLSEIQDAVDAAGGNADVQHQLDLLDAIVSQPNLPQSYEALLNYLDAFPAAGVDREYYQAVFQNLSSPLFFGQYTDLGIRESGRLAYDNVESDRIKISNIVPDENGAYEEWTLTAVDADTSQWSVVGSTSGFVGFLTAGETFNSQGKIRFTTTAVSQPDLGETISFEPDHKLTIHRNAPLETWNIIKVNSMAHTRAPYVSTGYGYIRDASGNIGYVTLLDPTIPTTNIILEARGDGVTFDLTSTEDLNHQGVVTAGVPYNDGYIAFTIVPGTLLFAAGDRFYIAIENLDAHAKNLDLGYGYDLDAYDNDHLEDEQGRKINFAYDGRFTDYDTDLMELEVTQNAVDKRKFRMRAIPNGAPISTLKKNGTGPFNQVDLQDATSGVSPDVPLNANPLYSMAGDANALPDLSLFYANDFIVEWSDNDFKNVTSLGTVAVGGTFESVQQGIKFKLQPGSKPFIAASSDDGLNKPRVEGGDVFSFSIDNPPPTLLETPIGLVSSRIPRLQLHSDSFYEVVSAKWTVKFDTVDSYTITGIQTGENEGVPVPGTPVTLPLAENYSYHDLNIHFTIVPGMGLYANDTFTFETFANAPSYLVHGSVTGWTAPAKMDEYYWNGKIGFKLTKPQYNVYAAGQLLPEGNQIAVTRLREDCPSLTYTFTKQATGYLVTRSDVGVIGHATTEFNDRYLGVILSTSLPEVKLDINAHDYPLFNAPDVVIVHPRVAARGPVVGDTIIVEKTEAGRLQINLTPIAGFDVSALAPITIDQRFIDLDTGFGGVPFASTSPESAILQGWLPMTATLKDSTTSIAEFSDPATSIDYFSAASGQKIGTMRPQGTNIMEPILFEWDVDFYNTYLPLNAEANILTVGTGWNDKTRVKITESIKLLVGGGALIENFLFKDVAQVSVGEANFINILTNFNTNFTAEMEDGPFSGYLPGYDNFPYDEEDLGYDQGRAPDLYSLLAKANLTAQEQQDILDQWEFYLNSDIPPTTAEQWDYLRSKLELDPNAGGITFTGFGYPAKGFAMDIVDRPDDVSTTAFQEAMVILAIDKANLHDANPYDVGGLDVIDEVTSIMFSGSLPPVPATIPAGTTYESLDTPLAAFTPSRVFEISFTGSSAQLAALSPIFKIWLPEAAAAQTIPSSVVEKVSAEKYRFSIPTASEAKIIVG